MQTPKSPKNKFPQSAIGQFLALAAFKPGRATFYALCAFGFYFAVFLATGSIVSSLFGAPFWPSVGLVFLLRLCFT